MSSFALQNTPYPDATVVYAYDATGYPSGFSGANPPGDPITSAEASGNAVEFTGLTNNVPYIAAGKVDGAWRYIKFIPEALAAPVVAEVLEENGKGYAPHGEDAEYERPSGFASVEWHGSAEPKNALDGDSWLEA